MKTCSLNPFIMWHATVHNLRLKKIPKSPTYVCIHKMPLSVLFVTMFKTRLTHRLIAAGPVWRCLSQVRYIHNARHSHSLTGRATQEPAEWNLSVCQCAVTMLSAHSGTSCHCQSVRSPCFLHTGHSGTSVSLCSHHVFCRQGTMEPQSVQSPCFPHTRHSGTSVCAVTMFTTHRAQWNLSLCSHHAFHTQGKVEPQSVQSPCFPHTGHNGTCLCSHHAFRTQGTMEPQSV